MFSSRLVGSRCALAGLDACRPLYQAAFLIAQAFEALARELDCRSAIRQAQLQCESLENDFNLGLGD